MCVCVYSWKKNSDKEHMAPVYVTVVPLLGFLFLTFSLAIIINRRVYSGLYVRSTQRKWNHTASNTNRLARFSRIKQRRRVLQTLAIVVYADDRPAKLQFLTGKNNINDDDDGHGNNRAKNTKKKKTTFAGFLQLSTITGPATANENTAFTHVSNDVRHKLVSFTHPCVYVHAIECGEIFGSRDTTQISSHI